MSRHWAAMGEAGALRGLQFMVWVDRHLGRKVFSIVLVPVIAYFFLRRKTARRASIQFLRQMKLAHPDSLPGNPGYWTSFRHFFLFGQSLLDKYVAWVNPPDGIQMAPDEEALLYNVATKERGVLLIGSHFGNLEYSRAVAHRHQNLVINILLYDQHAANFANLVGGSAPESRLNLIQVTDLDIELALQLKERVDAGEWVLIAGDRVPVGDSDNVSAAEFLGRPAPFPIGPYVLGSLLDCPVYLLHCYRDGNQYRLGMEHFSDKVQAKRAKGVRSYDRYVQRYAMMLERLVSKQPLQWFNFYDFWHCGNTTMQLTASLPNDDPD